MCYKIRRGIPTFYDWECRGVWLQSRRKRIDRRNYEKIISKKRKRIIGHSVSLTWKSIDLHRKIPDGCKTDENDPYSVRDLISVHVFLPTKIMQKQNFKKMISTSRNVSSDIYELRWRAARIKWKEEKGMSTETSNG